MDYKSDRESGRVDLKQDGETSSYDIWVMRGQD